NGDKADGSSVSAAGLKFTNSTNNFSAAGPSNADMPNLEDLSHNADDVGKFQRKVDEGFLVGYCVYSKAFRVLNSRTRIVQETLHVNFIENKPNVTGSGPAWIQGFNEEFAECFNNSSNEVNAAGFLVSAAGLNFTNNTNDFSTDGPSNAAISNLEDLSHNADDVGAEADINNMESIIPEPKRIHQALKDPSWIEAMQEELHQFKMQKVWILVDLPHGKRAIVTKWVYRNKKDERGIVIRNKARLVAQGHTQEEGIDYEEVFAPVAKIKAIRLFLAYASFMGFLVYQMDVKSAFLYGTIEEEVYVCQPPGFKDPEYPDKVYKVARHFMVYIKLLELGMKLWLLILWRIGLQVKQKKDGIFINQDKYVAEILRKFGLSEGKLTSTSIDAEKPLLKDSDGEDVDVHTYRSMIGSLMYLTSSSPDIMYAVCACARFQVTPKLSHLNAIKRIFRYLKGKPCLGLWYLKDSPFDLVAYSDSDYVVVATSSTEAEYVAAASGCAQVLWMQNQLLDYG
nr:retrovirus-related Pol polyprotein from transposon TNT 1-94 [Tanacetum cinerariifolium]